MAALLADETVLANLPEAMTVCGAFHPGPDDGVPPGRDGRPVRTLVLLGWRGGQHWAAFWGSAELRDGRPHPLDRWSRRLIEAAAASLGATAFHPGDTAPRPDFQRWALRGDQATRSPIGLLMHPRWGLWHSYRGALGFHEPLDLLPLEPIGSPCDTCLGRPCLSSCPVSAFTRGSYDVAACVGLLRRPSGEPCLSRGCAARRACPVLPPVPYPAGQQAFHMQAFQRSCEAQSHRP